MVYPKVMSPPELNTWQTRTGESSTAGVGVRVGVFDGGTGVKVLVIVGGTVVGVGVAVADGAGVLVFVGV